MGLHTPRRTLAAMISMVVLVGACSSSATPAPASSAPATPEAGATEAAATPAATTKKLTIGYVALDPSSVYAQQEANADKAAFAAEGWDVIEINAQGDPTKASAAMETLVSRKVDAIVVETFAANQINAGLKAANAANIPVFKAAAGGVGPGEAGAVSIILSPVINDLYLEEMQGKKVELLELVYTPGEPCRVRFEELNKVVDTMPNVSTTKHDFQIPGQVEQSQKLTSAWLSAHPEKADTTYMIWACYADPAIGAIAAENQQQRGPYFMYTWDLTNPTVQAIRDGTLDGTAILLPPGDAEILTQMIKDYMSTTASGGTWTPQSVDGGTVIVTKDNIDRVLQENPWVLTGQ